MQQKTKATKRAHRACLLKSVYEVRGHAIQGHGELESTGTADWLGVQGAAGWEETGRRLRESPGGLCELWHRPFSSVYLPCRERAGLKWSCHELLASGLISMQGSVSLWSEPFGQKLKLLPRFDLNYMDNFFLKWPEDNTANYSFLNLEFIMNIDKALISY